MRAHNTALCRSQQEEAKDQHERGHAKLPKRGEQWQQSADVAEFMQKGHVHFMDSVRPVSESSFAMSQVDFLAVQQAFCLSSPSRKGILTLQQMKEPQSKRVKMHCRILERMPLGPKKHSQVTSMWRRCLHLPQMGAARRCCSRGRSRLLSESALSRRAEWSAHSLWTMTPSPSRSHARWRVTSSRTACSTSALTGPLR